ncbi:MAG: septum formation initiator family protein [Candidatus Omnitrophica bacterium]|nr:septum formation initiator family protein [Candidatus Omnitrophota bacterium]
MKLTLGKAIIAAVVIVIVFFPTYSKIHQLRLKDAALTQKTEYLSRQNQQLAEEIEMLKTDPVYIEEVAREKLKVARENEIVFRVIDGVEE